MKTFLSLIFLFAAGFSQSHNGDINITINNKKMYDDEFTIKYRGEEELHIDRDYNLYLFGKKVETSDRDKRLLKDYVEMHRAMVKMGVRIGKTGAKLGVKATAAALGSTAKAIAAIFSGDEDEADEIFEDMENDIEYEAEKIEKLGEEIEDMADDLGVIKRKLKRSIPQLRDVEDF